MTQQLSRRQFLQYTGLLTIGMVAGCSDVEADYTVYMIDDQFFDPATLVIPVGATVAWQNKTAAVHTATCDPALAADEDDVRLPESAAAWHSGDLYNGEIWLHTFTTPGEYLYFCQYHELDGMIGVITVIET